MSPSHSINPRFPQGSRRQPNERTRAVRPVTIRQLSQTQIKEAELIMRAEPRYSLNGKDFAFVNPVFPSVGNVSDGVDLALTGHIRREHRRCCAFGRNHPDYPDRGWDGNDNIDAYDQERRRGREPAEVEVAVSHSSETRRVTVLTQISCRIGTYARVFGVPRKFKEAMTFAIYFIRPVEDPHEVFFHLMEAMVVTLQHSRGRPPVCNRLFVGRLVHLNIRVCHSQGFTTRGLRRRRVLPFLRLLPDQV